MSVLDLARITNTPVDKIRVISLSFQFIIFMACSSKFIVDIDSNLNIIESSILKL